MYVCMYGCVGSSFLCEGFPQLWQAGATPHRGAWASHHRGLSLPRTGSRRAGSVIVAHGPSRSAACGIFPDQGSNPRSLHWQADSQPLRHQGSPELFFFILRWIKCLELYAPSLNKFSTKMEKNETHLKVGFLKEPVLFTGYETKPRN